MGSLLQEAVARAHDFLLEPADAAPRRDPHAHLPLEVVVLGLSAGCGVTTLSRGLALSLQIPGERSSKLLTFDGGGRQHQDASLLGEGSSALVWDVPSREVEPARDLADRADMVVLVAGPESEPALAQIAAHILREDYGRVVLVANRVTDASRWNGRPDLCVPESRLGAALLGRGRRPPGAFGAAIARLALLVEAP